MFSIQPFITLDAFLNQTFTSYSLSVIPMFVLMGFLAYHAGIGTKVYSFAYKLVGRFPGGLAMATQVACAIFGAICGSSTATTATIGSIAIPWYVYRFFTINAAYGSYFLFSSCPDSWL